MIKSLSSAAFSALAALLLCLLPVFGQEVDTTHLKFPPCVAIIVPQKRAPSAAGQIWNQKSKLWPQRKVLEVCFLGGTSRQQDAAWKRFQVIDGLVGLTFVKSTNPSAHIRVDFLQSGHWSYIGTDSQSVRVGKQTMNLQLDAGVFGDRNSEWDRVAEHEILHAIGMEHEHQHPEGTKLVWNEPAVYDYYGRTQGWSKAQIRQQVLNRYKGGNWNGTVFDPSSIMEYPVPPGLANIVVGWNSKLSTMDIAYLRSTYPSP